MTVGRTAALDALGDEAAPARADLDYWLRSSSARSARDAALERFARTVRAYYRGRLLSADWAPGP